MRYIWNIFKKAVYAIDDALSWVLTLGSGKRKGREHVDKHSSSRTKYEIFRHYFTRRG